MLVFYSISEAINYKPKQEFWLSVDGDFFPLFIDYKKSTKWVVFIPGAFSRSKPMPRFQRATYSNELEYNVMCLFDPGLLIGKNITNSWFSGGKKWFASTIASAVKEFFEEIHTINNNVLIFGTSAGGLPGMKLAQSLPGSFVYAGNIQATPILHPAFDVMKPVLFPNLSNEKIMQCYGYRLDIRCLDGDYNLFYFQNIADKSHYLKHFLPFKEWYSNNTTKVLTRFFTYNDPESGHGTVGRENELNLINAVLESKEISLPLPEFLELS